jgi:uncharacterized membrane protein YfcA
MDFGQASTNSLFMIMAASLAAAVGFGRGKMVDWKLLLLVVPLAAAGSFAGGYFAHLASGLLLRIFLAVILLIAAFLTLRNEAEGQWPRFMPRWCCWDRRCGQYRYSVSVVLLVPAVGVAAFISGMIGIGGGVFVIPILILLFGCPTRVAIGVSAAYTGLAALPGFLGHLAGGSGFDIWAALPLAAAVLIGASIGPAVSLRMGTARLRRMLAVLLIAMALWMAADSIFSITSAGI